MMVCGVTSGQVKFYAKVDQPKVGRNQPIELRYIVENARTVDRFSAPSFPDFVLIQGPIESSGISITNGGMFQYKSLVFLLQPKNTGRLKIPAATAIVDGKQMRSNNLFVEVTNQNSKPAPQNTNPGFNFNLPGGEADMDREFYIRPGENIVEKIRKNLFVKVEVNKTSCFVNEPIVATYKLYSRVRSESRVVKRPSYNGFSLYDMVEPDGSVTGTETINGKTYNVHLIRQSQLFPLQPGTFTLEPVEVENTVRFIRQDSGEQNSFEDLFNPNAEVIEQTLNLSSKPVTITVNPLPAENQPKSFEGAVGNFTIQTKLAGDSIKVGEMINLEVRISGEGNLPLISAPVIKWPDGFESFESGTKEEFHPENFPMSGVKTFRFPFVPKKSGDFVIPGLKFSFFDPAAQAYRSDSTPDIYVVVKPGVAGAKNIHQPAQGAKVPSGSATGLLLVAGGIIVIIMVAWIIFFFKSEKRKKAVLESKRKTQESKLVETDPLKKARQLLSAGEWLPFLKEMENVIWKRTAEKLSIPSAALSQSRVVNDLNARGQHETAELFRALVNDCESSLYIPGSTKENFQDMLERARLLFQRLDSI